ncbi:putative ATP-grasp-modified RiPP [Streptosporangium sp. NPDC051022]|uniref:putative ATP-grasp-modified RiPP n=1 Tax=Streptosporangium sp. NPDC051022 TaxID=3155752 RepID=UPI00344736AC
MTITAEHSPLTPSPWGLTRTTDPLPTAEPPYDRVTLDPATQTTTFRDRNGGIVDMANTVTVTTSKGCGSDGSSGSSNVADDSNTDS